MTKPNQTLCEVFMAEKETPNQNPNMNTKQTTVEDEVVKAKRLGFEITNQIRNERDLYKAARDFIAKHETDSGKAPSRISDMDDSFILISDSQDIRTTLESIGKLSEINDVGCLFVQIADGDYSRVYACERSIPYTNAMARQLL